MDEENKVVQTTTSPEPIVETAPEVQENVSVSDTDTQPISEVDVENKETDSEQPEVTVSQEELNRKAEREKYAKLEKDNNELQQRAKMLEALDRAAANDPEFMRLANKKLVDQGLLDESVLRDLDSTPQVKTDGLTENPDIQYARQLRLEAQAKEEKFFQDFEGKHADLVEGTPEVVSANRSAIGAVAAKQIRQGVSKEDAFEYAYKLVMNPNQLVEDGKLQGLAQMQSVSTTEGAASGGVANNSSSGALTQEQKEMARRMGVSEEAYAKQLGE